MLILGIETSCDETSLALIKANKDKIKTIKHITYSQIKIHQPFGGVVPELAARAHLEKIIPLTKKIIKRKGLKKINLIAVTKGPGLMPSLLVGVELAKTLSYLEKIPILGINHLEGHIFSIKNIQKIKYPALSLIVSGGHTLLVLIQKPFKYTQIGSTLDDAAGECFDKAAQFLNLGYPGGPIISKIATKWRNAHKNKKPSIYLPRPMLSKNDFNFSFSGLKTALIYKLRKEKFPLEEVCAEIEQAIVDVLVQKTMKAVRSYNVKSLLLVGGVAANEFLRESLKKQAKKSKVNFFVPRKKLATDNAVMIALAGYARWQTLSQEQKQKAKKHSLKIQPDPSLSLK